MHVTQTAADLDGSMPNESLVDRPAGLVNTVHEGTQVAAVAEFEKDAP